jgi:hypothetical protein
MAFRCCCQLRLVNTRLLFAHSRFASPHRLTPRAVSFGRPTERISSPSSITRMRPARLLPHISRETAAGLNKAEQTPRSGTLRCAPEMPENRTPKFRKLSKSLSGDRRNSETSLSGSLASFPVHQMVYALRPRPSAGNLATRPQTTPDFKLIYPLLDHRIVLHFCAGTILGAE